MVKMAATVTLNALRKINILLRVTLLKGFGGLLLQSVKVVDVSLVVLGIVEAHKVLGEDGLKTIQSIWQGLQHSLLECSEVAN